MRQWETKSGYRGSHALESSKNLANYGLSEGPGDGSAFEIWQFQVGRRVWFDCLNMLVLKQQSRKNHKLKSQFKLTHLCNPTAGSKSRSRWGLARKLRDPQIETQPWLPLEKKTLFNEQQGRVAPKFTLRLLWQHVIRTCKMRDTLAIQHKFQVCKACSCKKSVAFPEHHS